MSTRPLLEVQDLQVWFGRRRPVRAVDGVSLTIHRGESVGLVGESGCGKSSLGRALVRLEPVHGGRIVFDGVDIANLRGRELQRFRHRLQMIFQDPFGSLNPRLSIGNAIDEVLRIHQRDPRVQRRDRLAALLREVGLDPAYSRRYPHEFSGGQRQRIGIARSLAADPELVIADEPVSALDVSVQVQILNLMKDLQQRMNLAYLFVAHDLAVVRYVCSRLLVMYLGRIVESGPSDLIYGRPAHPYTEALLSAVPDVKRGLRERTRQGRRIVLKGDIPSAAAVIPGCPFHPRCHRVQPRCRVEVPPLREVAPGRLSACHFAEEVCASAPA